MLLETGKIKNKMKWIIIVLMFFVLIFSIESKKHSISSQCINIGDQCISIGDYIWSLDMDVFSINIDSLGFTRFVATNRMQINIGNGFHHAIIEATIGTGAIYCIKLENEVSTGYTVNGQEIDSMKSYFNDYAKKLKNDYGNFDFSSDSLLPYKNFKDVKINSIVEYNKDSTNVFLSIQQKKDLMLVKLMYLNKYYKIKLNAESMIFNIKEKIKKRKKNSI